MSENMARVRLRHNYTVFHSRWKEVYPGLNRSLPNFTAVTSYSLKIKSLSNDKQTCASSGMLQP